MSEGEGGLSKNYYLLFARLRKSIIGLGFLYILVFVFLVNEMGKNGLPNN